MRPLPGPPAPSENTMPVASMSPISNVSSMSTSALTTRLRSAGGIAPMSGSGFAAIAWSVANHDSRAGRMRKSLPDMRAISTLPVGLPAASAPVMVRPSTPNVA